MAKQHYFFILSILLIMSTSGSLSAQPSGKVFSVDSLLNANIDSMPGLMAPLSIGLKDAPIREVLQGLAQSARLNIGIDEDVSGKTTIYLRDVRAREVLSYLCYHHHLELDLSSGVIHISKQKQVPAGSTSAVLEFDKQLNQLSVSLAQDSLIRFARELSLKSGTNLLLAEKLQGRIVSGHLYHVDLQAALQSLCKSWGITLRQVGKDVFLLESDASPTNPASNNKWNEGIDCRQVSAQLFSIKGKDVEAALAVLSAARLMERGVMLFLPSSHIISFNFEAISFDDFLNTISKGLSVQVTGQASMYLISETGPIFQLYRFRHRSINGILESIPKPLLEQAEAIASPELNLITIYGNQTSVAELNELFRLLDDSIPMVLLELTIVDHHKGRKIKTGVSAKLSSAEVPVKVDLLPAPDITLNTSAINSILNMLSSIGWYNLGYLAPEISLSLSAMEEQGLLDIRSTPKLAALSGHEASMSIGKTEYYIEERNDVIGTQNPQNIQTRQYKSVNADFSLKITPYVSGDGKVTLTVEVEQSDFTSRISPDAPPGKVSRKFSSTMCIENGQTLVLGGLVENSSSENSQGMPILNRIPLIKWLVSTRERNKEQSELIVFIRPIIN